MEVENRRRQLPRYTRSSRFYDGASRKGCGTRRIGHTQCNLTSCKKVPAYFFPQKAFPRPMLEVIDGRRSSADLSLPIPNVSSPRRNHARLRVSQKVYHITREHTCSGVEKRSQKLFHLHARWIVSVYIFRCLDLIRN